jgi:Fe-S cluster assembly iron-binding protein IscA
MPTLTENASDIVTTLVNKQVPSENGGLRISGPSAEGFAIAAVLAGEPGDTLVESGDARVYLEDSASQVLDDKVLDAQVTQDGNVQFQIAEQPR